MARIPNTENPIPLWQVLEKEFEALGGTLSPGYTNLRSASLLLAATNTATAEQVAQNNNILPALYALMHEERLQGKGRHSTALCFSGGGIRSATFNLGVLQALAEAGLLDKFDYLSTVSGGGYVGGWFSSWVARDPLGLDNVIQQLKNPVRSPIEPEPAPIRHLRAYSKYLAPQSGIMSVDTWVLITIYLRNLLVNWLVFMPLLLGVLMIPRVCAGFINIFPVLYLDKPTPATKPTATQTVAPAKQSISNGQIQTTIQVTSGVQPPSPDSSTSIALQERKYGIGTAPPICTNVCFALSAAFVVAMFFYARRRQPSSSVGGVVKSRLPGEDVRGCQGEFTRWAFLPLVLAAVCGTTGWAWVEIESARHFQLFALFGVAIGIFGAVVGLFQKPKFPSKAREFIAVMSGGLVAGAAMWASAGVLDWLPDKLASYHADWHHIAVDGQETAIYVCLAAPLFLLSLSTGAMVYLAFSSRLSSNRSDEDREWWARAGAFVLMFTVLWPIISGLVLIGPAVILQASVWAKAAIVSGGGLSGLLAILLGKSGLTAAKSDGNSARTKKSPLLQLLLAFAAPIFVGFLIMMASLATDALLGFRLPSLHNEWSRHFEIARPWETAPGKAEDRENHEDQRHYAMLEGFGDAQLREHEIQSDLELLVNQKKAEEASENKRILAEVLWNYAVNCSWIDPNYGSMLGQQRLAFLFVCAWFVGLLLTGYYVSHQIDLNAFSLHGLYRNRLVRAYLGASRDKNYTGGERKPNPFTGFDKKDNIAMNALWPSRTAIRPGPLHVVNMALNLVSGKNLAWQERKADSFTVSPLHSGNARVGYRNSSDYTGGTSGVSLGTSIAISGAAVSPNMGYHSSPFIAFLLTLFNARLGWWWGNPGAAGRNTFTDRAPANGAWELIQEAFGQTDADHPYVYLSDGGHFENLGLYEMVRRRCHSIVVGDAGQDMDFGFEDLGNAVRKIYIDMGIRISFTGGIRIYPRKPEPKDKDKRPSHYCAVASIDYRGVDGEKAVQGELVYIKPAFYGDEPADIYNYARECENFPHETTANQFFTESQFESYRNLGHYIGHALYPTNKLVAGVHGIIAGPRANLTMPYITEIIPDKGPTTGPLPGTASITICGKFHTFPTAFAEICVTFNDVPATNGLILSEEKIQVFPPAKGTGVVDVTVSYAKIDGNEFGRHTRYHGYTYE